MPHAKIQSMQATLFFFMRKANDTFHNDKCHFDDAGGLVIPSVGEKIEHSMGNFTIESRSFEYSNNHMEVTLKLNETE